MVLRRSHSALLSKYLEQYKRRPHSRVFAPLAEAYRKLGMVDEALKVLKEGIKRNPSYVLGYLVLSQCYADQFQWDRVHQTLLPLIAHHKDNISLQKLFAKSCIETGELELALETYKWLLFLNPRDKDFASQVADLEDDLLAKQKTIPRQALVKSPGVLPKPQSFDVDEDDWTMVNFSSENEEFPKDSEDNWEMNSAQSLNQATSKVDDWKVMSRELDDDFFSDDEVTPEYAEAPVVEGSKPLVSHTLVDLYVAQNHLEPAILLLEKFLEANPDDKRSSERLTELKLKMRENHEALLKVEESGQAELLRLVKSQVHSNSPQKIEKMYKLFLQQIQLRADEQSYQHV